MSPYLRKTDLGLSLEKRAIEFPLLAGRRLRAWLSLPLSLLMICLQGGHSDGVKKKRLPLAISGPEILLGLLTSCSFQRLLQMDGTPCLSHLLFILSGILLERDDNCFP